MDKRKYKELLNVYLNTKLKPQTYTKYTINDAIRDYSYKSSKIKQELDILEIQKKVCDKIFEHKKSFTPNKKMHINDTKINETHDESFLDLLSNRSFDNVQNCSIKERVVEDEESEDIIIRRKKRSSKKSRKGHFDFLCKKDNKLNIDFDNDDLDASTDDDIEMKSNQNDSVEEECIPKP